ncbi:hypothetical protein L3X14_16970 [Pseudomonas balearica]|uniref:hypothetical protein n=1 Tax=Stutzerimonas balearica TaxID=74829 RepID=UPI001F29FF1E|nr:hypothetical protein [Stutzerimonas balearica]MCF6758272.1 hypothetical protein [Stutzerimonas balearica]
MKKWIISLAAIALAGCGQPEPVTGDKLLSALKDGGVEYSNVQHPERNPSSPVPNSYKEHLVLTLPSIAPKGGQFFICDKKEYCDALYSYFDALKGLAGPYLYRSKDGLVVAQLNSGLQTQAAEQVQGVIEAL